MVGTQIAVRGTTPCPAARLKARSGGSQLLGPGGPQMTRRRAGCGDGQLGLEVRWPGRDGRDEDRPMDFDTVEEANLDAVGGTHADVWLKRARSTSPGVWSGGTQRLRA